MRGPIPCPLCVGLGFTQIETLFNSLLSLLKQVGLENRAFPLLNNLNPIMLYSNFSLIILL